MTIATESDFVRHRLRDVALYELAVQDDALLPEPWVEGVIDIEDRERKRRSVVRRLTNARMVAFKPDCFCPFMQLFFGQASVRGWSVALPHMLCGSVSRLSR